MCRQDTIQPAELGTGSHRPARDLPFDSSYNYCHRGLGINAYVIDTGIRVNHDDFDNRAHIAADFVGDGQNGNDCNGHGTHVAGILGGTNDGVAKKVEIYAVQVLNCTGQNGSWAALIAGVDWVTGNGIKPAVVNMSIGGSINDAADTAVRNSINAGFVYVVAAMNGTKNNGNPIDAKYISPARVAEAITVSSTGMQTSKRRLPTMVRSLTSLLRAR